MEIHASAKRHGIADEDIFHALEHAIAAADRDTGNEPPRYLVIGPDTAGNLLEIVYLELDDHELLVIHAMKLRPSNRYLLQGDAID